MCARREYGKRIRAPGVLPCGLPAQPVPIAAGVTVRRLCLLLPFSSPTCVQSFLPFLPTDFLVSVCRGLQPESQAFDIQRHILDLQFQRLDAMLQAIRVVIGRVSQT